MTRDIYFLRDVVTGQFYKGKGWDLILVNFDQALSFDSYKGARAGVTRRIRSWEYYHNLNNQSLNQFTRPLKAEALVRDQIPRWGIEIITGKITI